MSRKVKDVGRKAGKKTKRDRREDGIETQPGPSKATKREINLLSQIQNHYSHFALKKQMVIVGLANKLCLNYRPLDTINKETNSTRI